MGAVGRRGTPAEGEAAFAETAGKPVNANPTPCCEPVLAVAAEDAGRGGSWERRVSSRAIRDDLRPPVGRPLSLQSWVSCALSSESKSAVRRSACVAMAVRTLRLWWAEHAANTAIRDSVSTAALRVCFVCACLPAYFRFNRNYPLISKLEIKGTGEPGKQRMVEP